jgi:hypothetical protein
MSRQDPPASTWEAVWESGKNILCPKGHEGGLGIRGRCLNEIGCEVVSIIIVKGRKCYGQDL